MSKRWTKKRTNKRLKDAQPIVSNAEKMTKAQAIVAAADWMPVAGGDMEFIEAPYFNHFKSAPAAPPTLKEIQRRYGPPVTMGLPAGGAESDVYLAMDASLSDVGFYSQIQHAFALGQPPTGNGFVGYPALSELKQNGLISACVETVVDDMMREWIEIEYEEAGAI